MDADDKTLLMEVCPKAMIAQTTEWHPKDGGRGSEKLEAALRRERSSADRLGGGGGVSGGQPVADDAVVIDALTMALHRMVTVDPEITKATRITAATAARAAAVELEVTEEAKARAKRAFPPEKQPEKALVGHQLESPIQVVDEKTAEELQTEMVEMTKPVAAIWGNVDPRTARRAVSR
jgi:hypothetical protein